MISLRTNEQNFTDLKPLMDSFGETYKNLANELPVICEKTDQEILSIPSPDAVVIDVSMLILFSPCLPSSSV